MAVNTSSGRRDAHRGLSIGARMAVMVCALLAALTAAGGVWRYLSVERDLLGAEFVRQQAAAKSAVAQFTAGIEALRRDVAFLAGVPSVNAFLQARQNGVDAVDRLSEPQWRQRVTELFEACLRTTPEYFQVRLISADGEGREIVRVERRDGRAVAVPEQQLQQKSNRTYFQQALRAPPGAVYLSRVDLNEEHGKVSEPWIPTLRAATVIAGRGDRPLAVLVINKDLRPRFDEMRAALAGQQTLYVFDENLDFVLHPDPSRAFGFQFGKPVRLTQEFPQLRETLLGGATQQALLNDPATGGRVLASIGRRQPDAGVSSRSYGVLLTKNYDDVVAPLIERRWQLIAINLLIVLATTGTVLLLSRKLTRPLRNMTAAVRAFGHENTEPKLPTESGDEAGVLARAFDEMFHEVRHNQSTLQAEIAERARTEAALRQSDQRLRLALSAARAGAWEWDLDTGQTSWDQSVESMAAIDRATFGGNLDSWLEITHPDDVGNVPEAKRRAVEEDQPYAVEFRVRGREGDWRHWMSRGDLLRGGDGRPQKLVGIAWDVTEVRQAQEQIRQYATELERRNREMEQFVYSVSHDLKSPLVTCKGFTGILREDLADGKMDEALDSVERVERATLHMSRLIEDLLQLSRVGRVTNQPETVPVATLVGQLVEELRRTATVAVDIEIQPDLPAIQADPVAVSRLFQNLLANALRYGCGNAEPRILVGSRIEAGEVRFFVRDYGAGIRAEYQERIFGLFQRLETNHEGTGIGLAIVSKIMEVHGGRAWVESTIGEGATFWLGFPARLLAEAEPALPRSSR